MRETTAEVAKTIDASPAEIWEALVTPAKLKTFFFGAEIDSDWQVGSAIRMKGEYKGKPYEDKGEIVTFRPCEQLSFSHWSAMSGTPDAPENYHLVTFTLSPDGERTRVTLSQANLTGGVKASDREHRADYENNWRAVLDGLDKAVAH